MGRGHAEIAGGGLAGLTLAASLAQGGWTVCVHERDSDLRESGAGIVMWRNALWALEKVGALDGATARAAPIHDWHIVDHRGRDVVPSGWLFGRLGAPYAPTVVRQDIHRVLVDVCQQAGVGFKTNSRVVRATPDGRLALASGELREGDVVVGADGVRSSVRTSLGLARRVSMIGVGVARHSVDDYEHKTPGALVEWINKGRRVGIYHPSNSFTYFYTWCGTRDAVGRRGPLDRVAWARSFPRLEELFQRSTELFPWSPYEEVVCERWSSGKDALVGDAAHAMSADLGQGANCAMSNALSLGRWLLAETNVPTALEKWERAERPPTEIRQHWSRASSRFNLRWPGPLLPICSTRVWQRLVTARWADRVAALSDYTPREPGDSNAGPEVVTPQRAVLQ
jgi:2-polyprenyl-6-methoxyphenol hydroxylase-like FAD-dependent oxidoreductase